MADFICIGLLDPRITKLKKKLPTVGFEPGHFAYEANALSVAVLGEISIEYLNVDRALPECAIKIYLYRVPRGRCSKMFCRVLYNYRLLMRSTHDHKDRVRYWLTDAKVMSRPKSKVYYCFIKLSGIFLHKDWNIHSNCFLSRPLS